MQDLRDVEGGNANKLYADIAHPINQACRDLIQQSVIGEYALEIERANCQAINRDMTTICRQRIRYRAVQEFRKRSSAKHD